MHSGEHHFDVGRITRWMGMSGLCSESQTGTTTHRTTVAKKQSLRPTPMKIHLLTTQHRDPAAVESFWQQWGWEVVRYDNTGQPPGVGRNAILDQFYNSTDEWLAMADDDMVLDTRRGWGEQFLREPQKLFDSIGDSITSWGVMNNIHHRVDITLRNPVLRTNWVFYRASWIGCLVFHRNTGERFYNHRTDILEDMDWCLDQIQRGHRVAHCMNLVQQNRGGAQSTIFHDQAERRRRYLQAKQRIAREYPGITLTDKNRLVKTRFMNQYYQSADWTRVDAVGPSIIIAADQPPQFNARVS